MTLCFTLGKTSRLIEHPTFYTILEGFLIALCLLLHALVEQSWLNRCIPRCCPRSPAPLCSMLVEPRYLRRRQRLSKAEESPKAQPREEGTCLSHFFPERYLFIALALLYAHDILGSYFYGPLGGEPDASKLSAMRQIPITLILWTMIIILPVLYLAPYYSAGVPSTVCDLLLSVARRVDMFAALALRFSHARTNFTTCVRLRHSKLTVSG